MKNGIIDGETIKRDDQKVLEQFKKGNIDDIQTSNKNFYDDAILWAIKNGLLDQVFSLFPDPRPYQEVPISVVILANLLMRMKNEKGQISAPYLINDTKLMAELGYNIKVIEEGFNKRNKYKREAPFDGGVIKHILNATKADLLINWFNAIGSHYNLLKTSPGQKIYIIDGKDLEITYEEYTKFPNAGKVKYEGDEEYTYGYKAVWVMELLAHTGIIVNMTIVPINVNDLAAAKELLKNFKLPANSKLIWDRGFYDEEYISYLKKEMKVEVYIPLKQNLNITKNLIINKVGPNQDTDDWPKHPTRDDQQVLPLTSDDLKAAGGDKFKSGVLVRITMANGEIRYVPFVTTDGRQTFKSVLRTYDLREEIEEVHRQLVKNFGVDDFDSKRKYTHIIFKIITSVLAMNIYNLFLNSQENKDYKLPSIESKRKKTVLEKNNDVILYSKGFFTFMPFSDFVVALLEFPDEVRTKFSISVKKIFKALKR